MYQNELPKVRIAAPPYAASRKQHTATPKKPALSVISSRVPKKPRVPVLIVPKKHTKTIVPKILEPLFTERDVAYEFAPEHGDTLTLPSPKVSLPFSFSFFHIRRATPGIMLLIIGCVFASACIWSLQGAGRGTAIFSRIEGRAAKAFQDVVAAQGALANVDASGSERSFQSAFGELTAAQKEMDEALASSKSILRTLDVTGTVRSGQDLLAVGASLAKAGEHISRGIQPFLGKEEGKTLTDAISTAQPELSDAQAQLEDAKRVLDGISGSFLPDGLTEQVQQLKQVVPRALNAVSLLHQESDTLLALLGATRDRQYLFLFANNDEIRPVGGFIGTVGLVNIDRGTVEAVDVRSVYDGDGQLKEFLAPPNPLLPIVDRWYLRDSNWFVDFSQSASKAAQLFEKEGGPTVDGVVLLTPSVIENLLAVTGPIAVPGYAQEVSAENFVTVTQGEVTYNYDRQQNTPKKFLSDLTPILLTKLFASSGGSGSAMQMKTLSAFTKSLAEKDMLLFFRDEAAQRQAEDLGWAGSLPPNALGFLMVNNANIGGHKSDQFIEQEIDARTTILDNGDADVVVTVRRTHKGPQENISYPYPPGENPATKVNTVYQRLLVPKGAQLIESKGFTPESDVTRPILTPSDIPLQADPDVTAWQLSQRRSPTGTAIGSEAGYTFFANWIVTKPGETTVTLTHYRVPNAVRMPSYLHPVSSYSLALYKQPGQQRTAIRASVQLPQGMNIVHAVPDSGVTRDSNSSIVYRGELTADVLPGIVFERN